jgi:electron transfer flavoprotein alpha subunit
MKEIFVIAEHRQGRIRPESLELAAFGKNLAQAGNAKLTGLVLSGPGLTHSRKFAEDAGLDVISLENEFFAAYNAEAYVNALINFLSGRNPAFILVSHTATGWDFAPRLSVGLKGSCITGITKFNKAEKIFFTRSICNGKISTETAPAGGATAVLTIMPGAAKPEPCEKPGKVEILKITIDPPSTRNLGYEDTRRGSLDLTKAEVIVSAGRGIGDVEKLELVRRLAICFDKSAIGASRPVVDAGWLPLEHQVGQTGQTVRPKLYIACGISGAIQHTAGMSGSELIVAINTDANANIFNIAHLGIIQDLNGFLPVLMNKIHSKKIN